VIFRRRLFHCDSGPRRATVWLRRRDADPHDFRVVRTATSTRFFEGRHHAGKDPAVDEAMEYIASVDKHTYGAYLIVTWTPHLHAGGSIEECDPPEEEPWK
jgi:hypothetical protein